MLICDNVLWATHQWYMIADSDCTTDDRCDFHYLFIFSIICVCYAWPVREHARVCVWEYLWLWAQHHKIQTQTAGSWYKMTPSSVSSEAKMIQQMRAKIHSTKLCAANCFVLQSLANIINRAVRAADTQNIFHGLWKDPGIKSLLMKSFLWNVHNVYWQLPECTLNFHFIGHMALM